MVEQLWARSRPTRSAELTVDLVAREVRAEDAIGPFELDDFTRWRLLEGLDDIGLTLRHSDAITASRTASGWLPRTLPVYRADRRAESLYARDSARHVSIVIRGHSGSGLATPIPCDTRITSQSDDCLIPMEA